MKLSSISLALFLLSVVFLVGMTLFESAMLGMSMNVERVLSFVLLVLPAATGAVLAIFSLNRKEEHAWLVVALLVLNALFASFHLMIVLVAG